MASAPRKELSLWDKGRIEGRSRSMSDGTIARELHIPHLTVSNFLARLKNRHTQNNLPHTGRPWITSTSQDEHIIAAAESNTHIPFAELQNIINIPISITTIHRRLQEELIRKWKAVKRPDLTEEHAETHLRWAIEHQHWIWDNWEKVDWSDECAVQKNSDPHQLWVFHHQGKCEKYLPKNVQGRTRNGGMSQLIWGCFTGTKLGPAQSYLLMEQSTVMSILRFHAITFFHTLMH